MNQAVIVSEVNLKGYNLSVTCRDNGEDSTILEELAYRTIGAWLWIASRLEQNVYTIPDELKGSVESRYAAELSTDDTDGGKKVFEFKETFGDARVTIWDTYRGKKVSFHLNSDDDLQRSVDTWCASQNAIDRAFEKWGDKVAESRQDAPTTTQQRVQTAYADKPAYAPENQTTEYDKPATPKGTPTTPNTGNLYTKRDAIAKLNAGDPFKMKVVQIEKHSKDGKYFYDLYEPYGGKAGQYSAASVFTDNEIAINSGLIADLDKLGVKLGQSLTGNWVFNCSVAKPKTKTIKGEEKTFTNIYVQSLTAI